MAPVLINLLSFQAGWFASVLGAARGFPWLGPVAVLVLAAFHLVRIGDRGTEARFLAVAGVAGVLVESAMIAGGFYAPRAPVLDVPLAPPWLAAMWVNFATTPSLSLRFLRGRTVVAALLGAVAGPAAYLAGERLGAIRFESPAWRGALALAAVWAAAVPALFAVRERIAQSPRRSKR